MKKEMDEAELLLDVDGRGGQVCVAVAMGHCTAKGGIQLWLDGTHDPALQEGKGAVGAQRGCSG